MKRPKKNPSPAVVRLIKAMRPKYTPDELTQEIAIVIRENPDWSFRFARSNAIWRLRKRKG